MGKHYLAKYDVRKSNSTLPSLKSLGACSLRGRRLKGKGKGFSRKGVLGASNKVRRHGAIHGRCNVSPRHICCCNLSPSVYRPYEYVTTVSLKNSRYWYGMDFYTPC